MRGSQDVDVLERASTEKPGLGGLKYALPVAAVVVVADQLSKAWALSRLSPGSCSVEGACIDLIGGAKFHLTFNTGAAFKSLPGLGPYIGVAAIVMSVFLFAMARGRSDRLGALLLGGIAGGAIGNLIDRIFRADNGLLSGAVVDFIQVFDWFAIFNIADSAIVVCVMSLIAYSILKPEVLMADAKVVAESDTQIETEIGESSDQVAATGDQKDD